MAFENFKNRGLVCLGHSNTEHLLDLLEDAQATLAVMLTSRHIGPLRDEAAAWAIKLKEICEVLDQVGQMLKRKVVEVVYFSLCMIVPGVNNL